MASEARVREALTSDGEQVFTFLVRVGRADGTHTSGWLAHWKKNYTENPVVQENTNIPIGWVLEANKDIVGYLGSIPLYCMCGTKRFRAAAATMWMCSKVRPETFGQRIGRSSAA